MPNELLGLVIRYGEVQRSGLVTCRRALVLLSSLRAMFARLSAFVLRVFLVRDRSGTRVPEPLCALFRVSPASGGTVQSHLAQVRVNPGIISQTIVIGPAGLMATASERYRTCR